MDNQIDDIDTSSFLIGPFKQIVTMRCLPIYGAIEDDQLEIITDGGIIIDEGKIQEVGPFQELLKKDLPVEEIDYPAVVIPGLIDSHTHLCFAGERSLDYAKRVKGISYADINEQGGGILTTVEATRNTSDEKLIHLLEARTWQLKEEGVTTCEVKSGYGLTIEEEIRHLQLMHQAKAPIAIVPTCLAAHTLPPEYRFHRHYLDDLIGNLLPEIRSLTRRVDIFVEKGAFSVNDAKPYLIKAKEMGFSLVVHADQFSEGGALLAAELGAISADHLEVCTKSTMQAMKKSDTSPIVLPGACLGLGLPFPKAREMLDIGLPLAIASDYNPGSAPIGKLLLSAALLGAYEKLSIAETLAAITTRAAHALRLDDRGKIEPGLLADLAVYPVDDYREIFYYQGSCLPSMTKVGGL